MSIYQKVILRKGTLVWIASTELNRELMIIRNKIEVALLKVAEELNGWAGAYINTLTECVYFFKHKRVHKHND